MAMPAAAPFILPDERRPTGPGSPACPCFTQAEAVARGLDWPAMAPAPGARFDAAGAWYTEAQVHAHISGPAAAAALWSSMTTPPPAPPSPAATATATAGPPFASPASPEMVELMSAMSATLGPTLAAELAPALANASSRSGEAADRRGGTLPTLTEAALRLPMAVAEFVDSVTWGTKGASASSRAATAMRTLDPKVFKRANAHARMTNHDITSPSDLRTALEAVHPQADGTTRVYEAMLAALASPPASADACADFALKLLHWERLLPAAGALPPHFVQVLLLLGVRSLPRATSDAGLFTTPRAQSTGSGSFGGTAQPLHVRVTAHLDARSPTARAHVHATDLTTTGGHDTYYGSDHHDHHHDDTPFFATDYTDGKKRRCGVCNGHHEMAACKVNPSACTICSRGGRVITSHTKATCQSRSNPDYTGPPFKREYRGSARKAARTDTHSFRRPGKTAAELQSLLAAVQHLPEEAQSAMVHMMLGVPAQPGPDTNPAEGSA